MKKLFIIFLTAITLCSLSGCGQKNSNNKNSTPQLVTVHTNPNKEEKLESETSNKLDTSNTNQEETTEIVENVIKNNDVKEEENENTEPELSIDETQDEEPEYSTVEIQDEEFDLYNFLTSSNADYVYEPTEEKPAYIAVYGDWQIEIYTTDSSDHPVLILNDCGTETRCIQYDFSNAGNEIILVNAEKNISVYKAEIEPLSNIAKSLVANKQEGNAPGIVPMINGFIYN